MLIGCDFYMLARFFFMTIQLVRVSCAVYLINTHNLFFHVYGPNEVSVDMTSERSVALLISLYLFSFSISVFFYFFSV